jgi:cytochrome c-type biogenesis protein
VVSPLAISADPLGFLVAFGAGMLSFLSPCVLPLVPAYVSMVSGLSANEIGTTPKTRPSVLPGVLGFILGFTVIFVILGAGASWLGHLLLDHQRTLLIPAGAVIVVLGLWLAGVGTPRLFMQERRFHPRPSRLGIWAPPVMGMAFAFGWTPCIGPILSAVLVLAAASQTVTRGVLLLAVYAAGLAIPFLLTAILLNQFLRFYQNFRKHLHAVEVFSGALLLFVGGLVFFNKLTWLAGKLTFLNRFNL